jgi:hypothetical protein
VEALSPWGIAEGVSGRPSRGGVSATGIGEVVSRRAVGEVSRVAVLGGLSGQGYREGVGGQTVPARLKKWGARKRWGPWKDGRGMR